MASHGCGLGRGMKLSEEQDDDAGRASGLPPDWGGGSAGLMAFHGCGLGQGTETSEEEERTRRRRGVKEHEQEQERERDRIRESQKDIAAPRISLPIGVGHPLGSGLKALGPAVALLYQS